MLIGMEHPSPSARVVEQRVRNRIIEYLALVADYEAQRRYDEARIANVPNELINQWEDWSPPDGRITSDSGVYSEAEVSALSTFEAEWEWVVANTPDPLPTLQTLHELPEWERLRQAAEHALRTLSERGPLPEDAEA